MTVSEWMLQNARVNVTEVNGNSYYATTYLMQNLWQICEYLFLSELLKIHCAYIVMPDFNRITLTPDDLLRLFALPPGVIHIKFTYFFMYLKTWLPVFYLKKCIAIQHRV